MDSPDIQVGSIIGFDHESFIHENLRFRVLEVRPDGTMSVEVSAPAGSFTVGTQFLDERVAGGWVVYDDDPNGRL